MRISDTTTRPADPTIRTQVDLSQVLGTSAVAGFTGATGGAWEHHEVLGWDFTSDVTGKNAAPTGSQTLVYDGTQPVTLNGNAPFLADRIRLTESATNQTGSVFLTDPLLFPKDYSFNAQYAFSISTGSGDPGDGTPPGADGMAFVIHKAGGPDALGGAGGGLGLDGLSPIVAVEMDTWNGGVFGDNNGDHLGIDLRGGTNGGQTIAATSAVGAFPGISGFHNDGTERFVWVDYNGATDLMDVFISDMPVKPGVPTLSASVDFASIFGPTNELWVGFTAGTGGAWESHDVFSFSITHQVPLPEPATMTGAAMGLLALLGWRRRRSA